ncbi:hypothetical protein MMC13_006537 [Lambiella insularis]|nr:hypothetical protein [Lambiella insularis]
MKVLVGAGYITEDASRTSDEHKDVFGTVVDWRLTVTESLKIRASAALSSPTNSLPSATRLRASNCDWPAFAQRWRDAYMHFTRSHQPGENFKSIDDHHLESLVTLLAEYRLQELWTADEVAEISRIWHFLLPWPDSSRGLEMLNEMGIQTCTLSNGNVSLLTDMAAFAHLPWTRILSSEHFGMYKPAPEVYRGAVQKLGLEPGDCAMVAAHLADLKAASGCGLKTIYVERKQEEAWSQSEVLDAKSEGWVSLWVGLEDGDDEKGGFLEVARRLEQ